ncbi:MAG: hypothetical protein M3354_02015, partial [Chloroflexota bacterium]|nr:hypothetical protein [Chloroflexota bacterium]
MVAPHRKLGVAANAVLEVDTYSPNGPVPRAMVIPAARDGGLRCVILLSADLAESMTADTRPDELVSSLLEELLHVQVYATRWLQGGFTEGQATSARERDLRILSDRIHDEYFTCRRKGALSATLLLYDAPGMPGYRTTRIIVYG